MTGTGSPVEPYLAEFERFERLPGVNQGRSGGRLRETRRTALDSFARTGFPDTHQEEWRRTSVRPLANISFRLGEQARPPSPSAAPAGRRADPLPVVLGADQQPVLERARLVFVNGRLAPWLSSGWGLPAGALAGSLAEHLRSDGDPLEKHLARLARVDGNPFVALNTAFLDDGAYVAVPPDTSLDGPIHLVFLSAPGPAPTVCHPRALIVLGASSRATVIESHIGPPGEAYFTNAVTEIVVEENASVEHYTLQRESRRAFHVATLQAHLSRGSAFSSRSVSLGGALVRNDIGVTLAAEGADCTLDGLFLAASEQHVDNHTVIDHATPRCTSRELYKGIIGAGGSGVFNGKIIVRKDAHQSDAAQVNKNLLLSDDALMDTAPQLEIHNNDVKCRHAAAIGRLDQDAIFYLRSRGMARDVARSLLVHAFASEIIRGFRFCPIRDGLDEAVSGLLAAAGGTGGSS